MCRLLSYQSTRPTTMPEIFGENFKEFVSLAELHGDGWGIASKKNTGIEFFKEPVAATKSLTFESEVSKHKSESALLHLRWATEGMEINQNNTHPFSYQDITFIHNGSITPSNCLDSLIDEKIFPLIKGSTDSEKYFYYLITQINRLGFLEGTLAGLKHIKNSCTFSSINMMMINSDYLLAACVYNQNRIPEKFQNQADYYNLRYRVTADQIIVASSGWNQVGWMEIPNGSILVKKKGEKEKLVKI